MEDAEINQIVLDKLRIQRIEADDRALQNMVNLEVANRRVAELEKELKTMKDKELSP